MMKYKCLFLTGDMQTGKSTAILESIRPYPRNLIGGFMCQRLINNGETKAFCLTEISSVKSAVIEYKADIPNIFLENKCGKWERNDEVFDVKGAEMLSDISSSRLIILDEIGGFELLSEKFMEKIYDVLFGGTPVIGVIKSNKNKSIMEKAVKTDDKYTELHRKLFSDIENNFGGKIVRTQKDNMVNVQNEIKDFLNKAVRGALH